MRIAILSRQEIIEEAGKGHFGKQLKSIWQNLVLWSRRASRSYSVATKYREVIPVYIKDFVNPDKFAV